MDQNLAAAAKALLVAVGQTGWINCTPTPSERRTRIDLMNALRTALEESNHALGN
jgi:hypothetical protein